MAASVYEQFRQLAAALVTGGAIGLMYDLLRVSGGVLHRVVKVLFAAAAGIIVFAVGRASGTGLRLFFLLATAGGACFYLWAVHPIICADLTEAKQHLQCYAVIVYRNALNHVKKRK